MKSTRETTNAIANIIVFGLVVFAVYHSYGITGIEVALLVLFGLLDSSCQCDRIGG